MGMKSPPSYPDAKATNTFEQGLEFQDFVIDVLCRELGLVVSNYSSRRWQFEAGENKQGIEIKLDNRMLETGNVSIEIGEKSRVSRNYYVPSGIMRDDNSWLYIQGNYELLFIFAKRILVQLYRAKRYPVYELPTIRKFHMPLADAEKYAAKLIDLRQGTTTTGGVLM